MTTTTSKKFIIQHSKTGHYWTGISFNGKTLSEAMPVSSTSAEDCATDICRFWNGPVKVSEVAPDVEITSPYVSDLTVEVTVVSIWSKRSDGSNVVYKVRVPAGPSIEDTLETVFMLTNSDDRPLAGKVCSTSAGDVMVLDGTFYLVKGWSFRKLTLGEAEKVCALTSRDTAMGYSWMKTQGLI